MSAMAWSGCGVQDVPAGAAVELVPYPAPVQPVPVANVTYIATGSQAVTWVQATPASTWTIPHSLGRRPNVALYDVEGNAVASDIEATATQVVVTFATPVAGSAILT